MVKASIGKRVSRELVAEEVADDAFRVRDRVKHTSPIVSSAACSFRDHVSEQVGLERLAEQVGWFVSAERGHVLVCGAPC